MTQFPPVIVDVSATDNATLAPPATVTLRESVREFLRQTLQQNNFPAANFYEHLVEEIEAPMLEMVLQYVHQNQSKAARILNLSRGTLRKKMRRYGLLPQSRL